MKWKQMKDDDNNDHYDDAITTTKTKKAIINDRMKYPLYNKQYVRTYPSLVGKLFCTFSKTKIWYLGTKDIVGLSYMYLVSEEKFSKHNSKEFVSNSKYIINYLSLQIVIKLQELSN